MQLLLYPYYMVRTQVTHLTDVEKVSHLLQVLTHYTEEILTVQHHHWHQLLRFHL